MIPPTSEKKVRSNKPQFLLATAAMASGLALVVTILTKTALVWTLLCLGFVAASVAALKWSRTRGQDRPIIRAKAIAGIKAGLVATVAYDLWRMGLVTAARFHFFPFETFKLFGYLIVGEGVPQSVAYAVGAVYHAMNGVLFAVAYCLVFGGRHWFFGVLWALGLEASMFTLYPGWLDLRAVMKEFTIVSLSGHVVYGSVLGILSQRWLRFRLPIRRKL